METAKNVVPKSGQEANGYRCGETVSFTNINNSLVNTVWSCKLHTNVRYDVHLMYTLLMLGTDTGDLKQNRQRSL